MPWLERAGGRLAGGSWADVSTREFAGTAKVLMEFVDHHAKEEEKTVFPPMKKLFSTEELQQLDVDYEPWKGIQT